MRKKKKKTKKKTKKNLLKYVYFFIPRGVSTYERVGRIPIQRPTLELVDINQSKYEFKINQF